MSGSIEEDAALKVDYVSVGLDSNPAYAGMWNLFSQVWKLRFNVHPVCWFVGNQMELAKANLSQTFGTVYMVDAGAAKGKCWAAPYAGLVWGPSQLGGTVMTSGIDQIPMTQEFLLLLESVPDDVFFAGFGGASSYREQDKVLGIPYYPSSHMVATRATWSTVVKPCSTLAEDVQRVLDLSPATMWENEWGTDEAFLAWQLNKSGVEVRSTSSEWFDDWDRRRLCRARGDMPDKSKLWTGYYTEAHLHRPMSETPREWMDVLEVVR